MATRSLAAKQGDAPPVGFAARAFKPLSVVYY